MGQLADLILTGAKRARAYAEKLTVGITPEQAARKPRFETAAAPVVIDTNHPAFVFGHLSLYPARIMQLAGLDPAPAAAPAGWEALFQAKSECRDDPQGTIYPAWGLLTAQYFSAHDAVFAAVAKLDDKALLAPTPDPRYRENFPLVGTAAGFMLNNHVMMHLGQVSAWRRCFGLPSAM